MNMARFDCEGLLQRWWLRVAATSIVSLQLDDRANEFEYRVAESEYRGRCKVALVNCVGRRASCCAKRRGVKLQTKPVVRLGATALFEADGFADTVAEEVELRASHHAGTFDNDFVDARRVKRELTFDTFAGNDAANGEGFVDASASSGNDGAAEDLDAFFVAFQNLRVDIDGVADLKFRLLFLHTGLSGQLQQFVAVHGNVPFVYRVVIFFGQVSSRGQD